ncbi:MAG: S8 family serine peptidase [Candidatus Limnocylindria bacterium]
MVLAHAQVDELHAPAGATANAPGAAIPGPRYLVRFAPDADEAARSAALASIGAIVDVEIPELRVTRIVVPADAGDVFGDEDAVAASLAAHPAVARAERDLSIRLRVEPNDPYYLTDPYSSLGQWGLRRIEAARAWDFVSGAPSIVVAVLDTGFDPAHPDLAGAIVPGTTFVSQPSSECASGATQDDSSHGTHVAGIIGATRGNSVGVAGIASGVKLMPVKVLDCTGVGSMSDVSRGIVWATDNGARIVNISLGSPADVATLRDAVRYATSRNVLVVASSGNCGLGSSARCGSADQVEYPAGYPEVLSVGAVDENDARAPFSSANESVDVSAPGRRIVSTTPTYPTYLSQRTTNPATLTYAQFSGTSQAAPHASGVAALIWSLEPGLSAPAVVQRLRETADDLGATGTDPSFGAGRINALRAVTGLAGLYRATYDIPDAPLAAPTLNAFIVRVGVTNRSSFTWSNAGANAVRLSYHWSDLGGRTVVWDGERTALPRDVAFGETVTIEATVLGPPAPGTYLLRFDLVREGVAWFSDRGVPVAAIAVQANGGYGATYQIAPGASALTIGVPETLPVEVRNTGTHAWIATGAQPVRLSYHWYTAAGALVVWDGLRAALPKDVPPGEAATVDLFIEPPTAAGAYLLRIDLVHEGVAWFSGQGVTARDLFYDVTAGYGATYTVGAVPQLLPGGRLAVPATVRNDGPLAWSAAGPNPVRVASHVLARLTDDVLLWDGERTALAADVAPGVTVQTAVVVDAPREPGTYRLRLDLVREGIAWFSGLGVPAADVTFNVVADYRATLPSGPLSVSRAAPAAQVTVTNPGAAVWNAQGRAPVNVSAHWLDASGAVLVWDGPRTPLPGDVRPGQSVTLTVALGAPPAGATHVVIDLVAEGVRWFGAGAARPVTLLP